MGNQRKGRYTLGYRTKADIRSLTTGVSKAGTLTTSGTTLTGVGTTFTDLEIGDVIYCSSEVVNIASITDDTNATIASAPLTAFAGETWQLLNPKRIKRGATVFNITDRISMTYTGDNILTYGFRKGEFISGQCARIRNAYGNATLNEGEMTEPSETVDAGMILYDGTIDHALGVVYYTTYPSSALPLAVVGVHNTDEYDVGTLAKGEFCVPDTSNPGIRGDGTTESSDQCAFAMTNNGTPATGEVEAMLNFLERL